MSLPPNQALHSELTLDADPFPINNIVIPFDDSKYSNHAFRFALSLAKKVGASISIVTIVRAESDSVSLGSSSHQTIIQKSRQKRLEAIFQSFAVDAAEMNVNLRTEILSSENIAESIIWIAARNRTDLIIMGTRGRGAAPSYMKLGSVAMEVSQSSKCPVMLVH